MQNRDVAVRFNSTNGQLSNLPIRICLLLSLILCIYQAGRRGIGNWYFRQASPASIQAALQRSEERRVGKECRFTGVQDELRNKSYRLSGEQLSRINTVN